MSKHPMNHDDFLRPLTVSVPTPSRSYDVICGQGLLAHLGTLAKPFLPGEKVFIVSDSNVWPLYGERISQTLRDSGLAVNVFVFKAGEPSKSMGTLATCLESMADAGLTRDDGVVCVGGGVVGDLGGLAAALYMRGTRVVQVPTSLLAMVDSSVGGKTAIDLAHGKNLAGAFFQPSLVVADTQTLTTLPLPQLIDAFGEVIKHAILQGPDLFYAIAQDPLVKDGGTKSSQKLDLARMTQLVAQNVEVKRDVVVADETESGLRQTLNLGHTIGHAIEAASHYQLSHGACVAVGLAIGVRGSQALGLTPAPVTKAILRCLSAYGLPTATNMPLDVILSQARSDKKRHGERINMVVVRYLGSVEVVPMTFEEFSRLVEAGL